MSKKSLNIWLCVNKNGYVNIFNAQPIRNREAGKWVSKYPFVNSAIYGQMKELATKAQMTWESEPEYFEIAYE